MPKGTPGIKRQQGQRMKPKVQQIMGFAWLLLLFSLILLLDALPRENFFTAGSFFLLIFYLLCDLYFLHCCTIPPAWAGASTIRDFIDDIK
jgi:hypothetical protein